MNFYNGYSPHQRMKAYKWLMSQYASGNRTKPTQCDSCALVDGIIEPHSEDYSEPFGDHIGQYNFCYRCHMMLHCRKNSIKNFELYCLAIKEGSQFQPFFTRDWSKFKRQMLESYKPLTLGRSNETTNILHEIHTNLTH